MRNLKNRVIKRIKTEDQSQQIPSQMCRPFRVNSSKFISKQQKRESCQMF